MTDHELQALIDRELDERSHRITIICAVVLMFFLATLGAWAVSYERVHVETSVGRFVLTGDNKWPLVQRFYL